MLGSPIAVELLAKLNAPAEYIGRAMLKTRDWAGVVIFATEMQTPRLRVRRVNEHISLDTSDGKWHAICRNGGAVCNSYDYPAETEIVVAVATPGGPTIVWCDRRPANKVTNYGAAKACLGEDAAALFHDGLLGRNINAREKAWKMIKSTYWTVLGRERF